MGRKGKKKEERNEMKQRERNLGGIFLQLQSKWNLEVAAHLSCP